MSVIEELLNLVITFAIVMAPLWILISRRRRMQQEQQQRQQQQGRPPGQQQPVPRQPDRYGRETERESGDPRTVTEQQDYRARGREDESYTSEQRRRARTKAERQRDPQTSAEKSGGKPTGRLEKMLRELLGIPDEEEQERARREREARRRSAERSTRKRSTADRQPLERPSSKPEAPRHADVTIRSVLPESGSLTLSPGGMGPQHMRTAAGNLGSASSADARPPDKESLGPGWKRANRLPDFKRAVLLAELLGKPHALKDRDDS